MRIPNMLRTIVVAIVVIVFLAIPCYADHSWGGEQGLVDTTTALTDHSWGGEQGAPIYDSGWTDDDPLGVDDSSIDDPQWQLMLLIWNMIG